MGMHAVLIDLRRRRAGACVDGKPIIALRSTTSKGESRIVTYIKKGGGVVTPRSRAQCVGRWGAPRRGLHGCELTHARAHCSYIVTEYGIAELEGKSLRERAAALIAIAHPDHRERLRAEASGRMHA
jgi:4-hydroxybutyrate CoA-transferase